MLRLGGLLGRQVLEHREQRRKAIAQLTAVDDQIDRAFSSRNSDR